MKKYLAMVGYIIFSMSFAQADEIEEGISYVYPFFDEDQDNPVLETKPKEEKSKVSKTAKQAKIGNFTFTADAKQADPLTQWQSDWEKKHEKEKPKEERGSRFRREREEKEDSDGVSFRLEWSSK